MTDDSLMSSFVNLSAILTGIAKEKLAPIKDDPNIKQTYLDVVIAKVGKEVIINLLTSYEKLLSERKSDREIGNTILHDTNIQISATARAIIKMWYLGSWYNFDSQGNEISGKEEVISSQAYHAGWIWRIMQAHPMGQIISESDSAWDKVPPPLSDFVGEES